MSTEIEIVSCPIEDGDFLYLCWFTKGYASLEDGSPPKEALIEEMGFKETHLRFLEKLRWFECFFGGRFQPKSDTEKNRQKNIQSFGLVTSEL